MDGVYHLAECGRSPEFGGPVYIKNNDVVLCEAFVSGSGFGVDNESVKVLRCSPDSVLQSARSHWINAALMCLA